MNTRWWIFLGLVLFMGGGMVISNREAIIQRIARAIAFAEGFPVAGSRPARNHNPGNLTLDLTGKAVGMDGMYVVYSNDVDGFEALEKQVRLMFGGSRIYHAGMTIMDIARRYTTTEQNSWARNVAHYLNIQPTTKLSEIV